MAPSASTETSKQNDGNAAATLREAVKCFNGTIDFEKLAVKMGVANGEAMRKRFKRLFDKDEEPLQMKGSSLGTALASDVATPTKTVSRTPKTPKTPKNSSVDGDEAESTPKTSKQAARKRKADTNEQSSKKHKTTTVKDEEMGEDIGHEDEKVTEEDFSAETEE